MGYLCDLIPLILSRNKSQKLSGWLRGEGSTPFIPEIATLAETTAKSTSNKLT